MLIFDAHLDLSMNALEWNRDLTKPLADVRGRERGQSDRPDRGQGVVTFDEMRRGQIGLCVATLIGRYVPAGREMPGWHSPEIAWAMTQGQLAWYRAMEEQGQMSPIRNRLDLDAAVEDWQSADDGKIAGVTDRPIGYLLSLEGADSILTPGHLAAAYDAGLRALGPAHYGPGRYAPGTGAEGPLEPAGRQLLAEMDRLGMILDVTHLTDQAFWESLDLFSGPVWASHNNCRSLVPHQRQLDDRMLRALIARDAVVGTVFDAWMLSPGWIRGTTTPMQSGLKMEAAVEHVDHICQLAGNARHCGIGSDLDGGYGREQCPLDLESIADLQRLTGMLTDRGYSIEDVACIMHGNWIRVLRQLWSE